MDVALRGSPWPGVCAPRFEPEVRIGAGLNVS